METCEYNCKPDKIIDEDNLNQDTYNENFIMINSEKIMQKIRLLMKQSFFYKNMYINDVVNIGGEIEITILELAQTIIKLTKSTSKIQHLAALEDGDMTRRRPDIKKMKKLLNRPMLPLEEGMQKVLNQLDWII
jgi:nucleoside-diphosphate-sugar epimerase